MRKESKKPIANNKRARFDYFTLETFKTGIELFGTGVKALRTGHCSVKEGWIDTQNGEIFIYGTHISPYRKGNVFNRNPLRIWKLLMHKSEIRRLIDTIKEKGLTPMSPEVYLKGRLVKVEIGPVQGKEKYDKRAIIAKNDVRRGLERNFKGSI